jgi:alkanesulfonate monooxygenase SsuD/methylene tetrahydromethanopterin reductase-like flavin-dependent oxidoreductase (luciferase family)
MAERTLQQGIMLHQFDFSTDLLIERAQLAEELGFDSAWIGDHMWATARPDGLHPECLALLTGMLMSTKRLRIGPLVICYAFRNPALLAKMLCTIDHLGKGRLEIGLGIGWKPEEFKEYGYDFAPTAVRLRQFEETLEILKLMFTQRRATFSGRYYTVTEAHNNPKPLQQPHPPITIAGTGKQVMLRLVAKYADWWNVPGSANNNFEELLDALRTHCQAVGRDFSKIKISQMNWVCLGANQKEVDEKAAEFKGPFELMAIRGTPDQIIAAYQERARKGINLLITQFTENPDPKTIRSFAREVMPALR